MHRRYRMRDPYHILLPNSGHVAWWVALHTYNDEIFVNNDEVCKLERELVVKNTTKLPP